MAGAISSSASSKRCAVVTGANKGIGFEICRQLASNGVFVVLTARDERRGAEAVEKLRGFGHSDVLFHQLDVMDSAGISSLADYIKARFGKLDILVNNAGIGGVIVDVDAFVALKAGEGKQGVENVKEVMTENYELAKECLKTNYYGAKELTEALIPMLQFSSSPRVVNVSSSCGLLKNISYEKAKLVLNDVDNLTEVRVDEVLNEFLEDLSEGMLETKGWPTVVSSYSVSKAALNAYTRLLAKKYPTFIINCVCPGYVKTDINYNTGMLPVEEGGESPVRLALLADGGPSGFFFIRKEVSPF